MTRLICLLARASLLCLPLLGHSQSFQPKIIQFNGDAEHSSAELMAAANLKPGMTLTAADMDAHTKLLVDTGIFDDIQYRFNGQDLIFQLSPSTQLYPLKIENLPIATSAELNDRLHAKVPLYHGKLPLQGGLTEAIRKELESELAEKGIQGTVTVGPFRDTSDKITGVSYVMTSPEIRIGEVLLSGASAEQATAARRVVAKAIGGTYSIAGSINQLETLLASFYREQGYLDVKAQATAQPVLVDSNGVRVPFAVAVEEGTQYHLGGIQIAPGALVSQTDFDKQSDLHPGDVVVLEKLRNDWAYLGRQYHNKGFMHAEIKPDQTIDKSQSAVSYTVNILPGPVYTMGTLKVENVTDDLRAMILKAWPIPPGSTFNEGAIAGMTATHNVNPALERVFALANARYRLTLHDDAHTVDVDLTLEKKH